MNSILPVKGNIGDLAMALKTHESVYNPDAVFNLNELNFSSRLSLEIPGRGSFNLTPWARRQAASILGVKWDRWFENADMEEQAFLLNIRLKRANQDVKLRTYNDTLAAIVSPGYTPIDDSSIATILNEVLPLDCPAEIMKSSVTDKTISYTISLSDKKTVGGKVGDVIPGLYIQNSGVGYCSLKMYFMVTRLVCSNGLCLPIAQFMLLRKKHTKGIADGLFDEISSQCFDITGKINNGLKNIEDAQIIQVNNPEAEVTRLLKDNGLPQKMIPMVMEAWNREPLSNKFGISQALTDNRMIIENNLEPETAEILQRLAGSYLLLN